MVSRTRFPPNIHVSGIKSDLCHDGKRNDVSKIELAGSAQDNPLAMGAVHALMTFCLATFAPPCFWSLFPLTIVHSPPFVWQLAQSIKDGCDQAGNRKVTLFGMGLMNLHAPAYTQNIPKWKKKRMILERMQQEHEDEMMLITTKVLDPHSKAARKQVVPCSKFFLFAFIPHAAV